MATAIDRAIAVSSCGFVIVLAVAAYWDPGIRILHVFESIPYLITAALCLSYRNIGRPLERRKFAYALASAAGIFWLCLGGVLTSFVRNGFERLATLASTGHLDRPDILIAVPAALTTGAMALLALFGYLRLHGKRWLDLGTFAGAFAAVTVWFVALFALFAPQYLGMFKRLHL